MGLQRCHVAYPICVTALRALCVVLAAVASPQAGNDASAEGRNGERRNIPRTEALHGTAPTPQAYGSPPQRSADGSLRRPTQAAAITDSAEGDNLVGGQSLHERKRKKGPKLCPIGDVPPSNCTCGDHQAWAGGNCGCNCEDLHWRCICPVGGYYNKAAGMVICRPGYNPSRGFDGRGVCNEAPRCHVGQKIGPHCDCKDDAVEGRCGCQCQQINESCSCPYHAHLKSGTVTCNDGLQMARGGLACVADWQMTLLVAWGVLIFVAAALLLFFVFGTLRAAGVMPCRSEKAHAFEDREMEADVSDPELPH